MQQYPQKTFNTQQSQKLFFPRKNAQLYLQRNKRRAAEKEWMEIQHEKMHAHTREERIKEQRCL